MSYQPGTIHTWVIYTIVSVLAILNFIRIDDHSHSASDTLIQAVPQTILLVFVAVLTVRYLCR